MVGFALLHRPYSLLALLYAKHGQFWHRLKTAGIKVLANPLAVSLTRPVIAAFLERA
jgi:hypothetical protein